MQLLFSFTQTIFARQFHGQMNSNIFGNEAKVTGPKERICAFAQLGQTRLAEESK